MNGVLEFYHSHKAKIDAWAVDTSHPELAAYARTIQIEVAQIEERNTQVLANLGEEERQFVIENGLDLNQLIQSRMKKAQEEG